MLARTPDAPEGVKGISLFVVPKFLVNKDGSLGARNDAYCVSLEHKLGIHGSPTAVMQYGDKGGAIGYLVGEENRGLEYMFIMMNLARFGVGLQGIGIVCGAWALARVSVEAANRSVANHPDKAFYEAKLATLRFYVDTMIPEAVAAADTIVNGSEGALALDEAAF